MINQTVYYINIDKQRNEKMKNQIQKMKKYNIKRFQGINTKEMDIKEYSQFITKKALNDIQKDYRIRDHDLTLGGLGCALSHISLWKKLLKSKEEYYIILEDDIIVDDKLIDLFIQTYDKTRITIDPNIDMMIYKPLNLSELKVTRTKINDIYKIMHFWGLGGYIITQQGAKKLLDSIFPLKEQIDSYISFQIIPRNLSIYASDIVKLDYTTALNSQIQTKCMKCNDGISLYLLFDYYFYFDIILIICIIVILHTLNNK